MGLKRGPYSVRPLDWKRGRHAGEWWAMTTEGRDFTVRTLSSGKVRLMESHGERVLLCHVYDDEEIAFRKAEDLHIQHVTTRYMEAFELPEPKTIQDGRGGDGGA